MWFGLLLCSRGTDTQRICGNSAADLWNCVGLVMGCGSYVGTVRGLVEVHFALQHCFVGVVC